MKKRISAILLAMLLALPFTGCSDNGTDSTDEPDAAAPTVTGEAAAEEEAVPEEEERIKPDIPTTGDFGGDVIQFLFWDHSGWAGTVRINRDIYAEALTGEGINDAVYNRNLLIEENYNVKIALEMMDLGQIGGTLKTAVAAGDTNYDVVYPRLYEAASMYQQSLFHNLFDVPHLDFTKPWWDQNCVESLSIGPILPAVATSINVNDKDATVAVAFNKDMAAANNLEDLYTTVREGRWIYDKVSELAEATNRDISGDGVMSEDDFYGFLGGSDVMDAFWHGAGGRLVTKDEEGNFVFSFGSNERDIEAADKIITFMNQPWFFNHHKAKNTDDAYYTQLFETGHGMFFWMRLDEVTNMRNGDTDFGILPVPKYDEAQEKYFSFVSQHTTGLMSIPITIAGDALDEVGLILEALAAESHYTLIPEYIESSLKTKHARDAESGEMLDIIISNRTFDPMNIYNFGGFGDVLPNLASNNNHDIASAVQKQSKPVGKVMDKFMTAMLGE